MIVHFLNTIKAYIITSRLLSTSNINFFLYLTVLLIIITLLIGIF